LHFTFYKNGIKVYSIMLMETLRFYVFFLVCYFFTKKAASLLTVIGGGPNAIPAPIHSVDSSAFLSTRLKSEDNIKVS